MCEFMEANNLAEKVDGGGDVSALASSSNTPTIKIDSIFIDLSHAIEKSETKSICEHFSIRGYVAEKRKMDKKLCWPFPVGDDAEDQKCMLPPLHVPKFRWWCCQNCLRDIIAKDFQQALKLDAVEGRKSAANNSVHGMEHNVPLYSNKKEDKVDLEASIRGLKNGFEDVLNKKILGPTHGAGEFKPCLMQKPRADDTAIKTQCNGVVDFSEVDCRSHGVSHTGFAIRNLKGTINGPGESSQTEKHISVDVQHGNVMLVNTSGHPSLEINECEYALSETERDGTVVGQKENYGNSGGLQCKKTQKVRFLTELLSSSKIKESPSKAIQGGSTGASSFPVPKKNFPRGTSKHQNGKRKVSEDEDWRTPQMKSPKHVKRKVRFLDAEPAHFSSAIVGKNFTILKGDQESACINNAYTVSTSEKTNPAGTCSSTGISSQNTKQKADVTHKESNLSLSKKRSKKTQVPPKDVVPKEDDRKIGAADKSNEKDNVLFMPACGVFSEREIAHSFGSHHSAQSSKKKSNLYKKKKKMLPLVEDTAIIPHNCGMLNEGPITRKDVKVTKTGRKVFPYLSAEDASHKKGPYLSQDSLTEQGRDKNSLSQVENGLDFVLLQQQSVPREHQIVRRAINDKYVENSRVPLTSVADESLRRQEPHDLSALNFASRSSLLSEKPNCTSRAEDGTFPLMQQKDLCVSYIKERPAGVQAHVDNTQRDQRAEKLLEQGTSDDIPMEIVELMAKNQYERCLQDSRELETASNRRSSGGLIDFAGADRNGGLRLFPDENPRPPRVHPNNATNVPTITDKAPQLSKLKSVNFFSHNRNHFSLGQMKETPASSVFIPFSQCQDMQSSGVHFSTAGSSQNCRFNGDTLGLRFSHTSSSQASEAYNVPNKCDEAAFVWPTVMSNEVNFRRNNPQKTLIHSANTVMLPQSPAVLHRGKLNGHDQGILSLNVPNPKNQTRNLTFENYNRENVEYPFCHKHKGIELPSKPMGTLDLYPNETKSAVHLLSLVQAAVLPGTACNEKLLKKTSFPRDNCSNGFSGLNNVVDKMGDALRYSSSEFYRGNHPSEEPCKCVPAVSTSCSCTSFLNNRNFEEATGSKAQTSAPKAKRGRPRKIVPPTCNLTSSLPAKKRGRPRKSAPTTCDLGQNHKIVPDCGMPYHGGDDLMKRIDVQPQSKIGTLPRTQTVSETEMCPINRNPADFSVPEAGNAYTIGAQDLKFVKRIPSGSRSGSFNLWHQRQKTKKLTAIRKSNEIKFMEVR